MGTFPLTVVLDGWEPKEIVYKVEAMYTERVNNQLLSEPQCNEGFWENFEFVLMFL